MNSTGLPYGTGSIIYTSKNTLHPYHARRYKGKNRSGNSTYITIGFYSTWQEAMDALEKASDKSAEELVRANLTLGEVLEQLIGFNDQWSTERKKGRRNLAKKYCGDFMDVPYRNIKAYDMKTIIGRAESTRIKRELKMLFSALDKEAERSDIPGKRYAGLLPVIRNNETDRKPDRHPYPPDVVQTFLEHRNDKDMYLVLFLCYTGFRQGAFRGILKDYVNLKNMTVTGGIKTTAGRNRTIPIHPTIQPFVKTMMEKPGKFLLTNEYGEAMGEAELTGRYQMATAPYISRHFVLHECRNTFYNKLMSEGVEEHVVCALMGHKPYNAGQQYYGEVTLEKKWDAIMRLW